MAKDVPILPLLSMLERTINMTPEDASRETRLRSRWVKIRGPMRTSLLVVLFLIPPMSLMAGGRSKQEIRELINEAEAKTNIFDLSSFEMKAAVRSDNYGQPLHGSYLLFGN